MKKIIYNTYPMAFHTPGGGEMQLLKYKEYIKNNHNVTIELFDQWRPKLANSDIVHFFSLVGGSTHFCDFIKSLNIPLIISSSLWITEETKHLYPINDIKYQLSLADKIIANSDVECEQISKVLGIPRHCLFTIYNGVDDIFFEHVSENIFRNQFNIEEKFVLNVGNIEPRKNQLELVKAIKKLPEYKLVLIGHKRDEMYSEEVLKLGGDQVIYVQAIEHEDPLLRSAYNACEVFCLPSTLETPGLAALEAAACGCKISITKIGATTEYFGDYVDYCDPENAESITVSIKNALNRDSAGLVQHISSNYRWKDICDKLVRIYEND